MLSPFEPHLTLVLSETASYVEECKIVEDFCHILARGLFPKLTILLDIFFS